MSVTNLRTLKSSLDRFIAFNKALILLPLYALKSSLDRFIAIGVATVMSEVNL